MAGLSIYMLEIGLMFLSYTERVRQQIRNTDGLLYSFKVVGEDKVVLLTTVDPEHSIASLRNAGMLITSMESTLLLPYETFAQTILGVNPNLTAISERKFNGTSQIFWFTTTISYQGMNRSDFVTLWAREATTALTLRASTNRHTELFKVVTQNKLAVFIEGSGTSDIDFLFWQLPLVAALGQNMLIVAKEVLII